MIVEDGANCVPIAMPLNLLLPDTIRFLVEKNQKEGYTNATLNAAEQLSRLFSPGHSVRASIRRQYLL